MRLFKDVFLFLAAAGSVDPAIQARDAPVGMAHSRPFGQFKHRLMELQGTVIRSCQNPGVVALTFDDGPCRFTPHLLDVCPVPLHDSQWKSDFFSTHEPSKQNPLQANNCDQILNRYGAKATFFVLGSGPRGDIDDWSVLLGIIINVSTIYRSGCLLPANKSTF